MTNNKWVILALLFFGYTALGAMLAVVAYWALKIK